MKDFLSKIHIWFLRHFTRANRDMLGYFSVYLAKYMLNEQDLRSLCYLADWKHSIEYGRKISLTKYQFLGESIYEDYFDFAPYLGNKKSFKKIDQLGCFSEDAFYIVSSPKKFNLKRFTKTEKEVLNFVIDLFIKEHTGSSPREARKKIRHLILSTYPATVSNKGSEIDLPKLAREYNKIKHLL
jgi:hypothetical protein